MNTFIHQEWYRKDREQLYTTDAKKVNTRNKIKHQSSDDAYSSKLMWTILTAADLNIKTDFNITPQSFFRNDIKIVHITLFSDKKACL